MEASSANFGTENARQISGAFEPKYTRAIQDTNMDDMHELKEVQQDQKNKHIYIVVDKNIDADKLTKMSDYKVVVENSPGEATRKKTKTQCNIRNICKCLFGLICIIAISAATSVASQKFISPFFQQKVEELSPEQTSDKPQHARLTAKDLGDSRTTSSEFHWAVFYLDHHKFYKGIERLPWKSESDEGTGITLTDTGCFKIHKTSVYEINPTITYEFTAENKTGSEVYHNVKYIRNGDQNLLQIHQLTIPYREDGSIYRILQSTNIMVLKEFQEACS